MSKLARIAHRSWSKALTAFVLAVSGATIPTFSFAEAQAQAQAQAVEPDKLVRLGIRLRREHRDAEALEVFRQANELRPTPRTRTQIGLAEQSLGQWVAAESDLRAALERVDDDWIARNRSVLDDALTFVSIHLGWLEVSGNVTGARVLLDGVEVGAVPMGLTRVKAGEVELRVEADGFTPAERMVSITVTGSVHEFATLTPLPVMEGSAPVESPEPRASGSTPKPSSATPGRHDSPKAADGAAGFPWAAAATAAVGIVGISIGAVYGLNALTTKATRDQHCEANRCDPVGLQLDSDARRDVVGSDIGFGVCAAGVLATVWLLWKHGRRSQVSFGLVPTVAPRVAGLDVHGSF
jgi:hypothetical protein